MKFVNFNQHKAFFFLNKFCLLNAPQEITTHFSNHAGEMRK